MAALYTLPVTVAIAFFADSAAAAPPAVTLNTALLSLNYLLMIVLPLVVGVLIARRTGASWRFFVIGAVTFVLSQVGHIPFNALVQRSGILPAGVSTWPALLINALFLGLSAGVFEETARYLAYRFWATDARTWSRGLMMGAGHGGGEAILLGLLAGINFVGLLVASNSAALLARLGPDEQALIAQGVADIAALPWYDLLLGAAERVFAIALHLTLSVMVLQVFLRRSWRWLPLAIGWHALFNATAVIAVVRAGPYVTELLLGLLAAASLVILFRLRTPDPPEAAPPPPTEPVKQVDLRPTAEALDRSRYS